MLVLVFKGFFVIIDVTTIFAYTKLRGEMYANF